MFCERMYSWFIIIRIESKGIIWLQNISKGYTFAFSTRCLQIIVPIISSEKKPVLPPGSLLFPAALLFFSPLIAFLISCDVGGCTAGQSSLMFKLFAKSFTKVFLSVIVIWGDTMLCFSALNWQLHKISTYQSVTHCSEVTTFLSFYVFFMKWFFYSSKLVLVKFLKFMKESLEKLNRPKPYRNSWRNFHRNR